MPPTLPPEDRPRHYMAPVAVLPFAPRSAGARHQRELRIEREYHARVMRLADAQKFEVIARLRTQFENAADPPTTPDPDDETLRRLCRELHGPDQADDTARFELMDGAITPAEETTLLRAIYLTQARLHRAARCLEARKGLR